MFSVQYQWKILSGKEKQFESLWHQLTLEIKKVQGMVGAKLMKLEDGTYLAQAQWKTREDWEKSHERFPTPAPLREKLAETIESNEGLLWMEVIHDVF